MLRLAVAACGTKSGLSKWTVHLLKNPGVCWGKKYISCRNNTFLKVQIYIYICVCVCVSVWFITNLLSYQWNMLCGAIGWSPRILGSLITKFPNISCLNSHFLSQFMLQWNLYQHICLTAFVCYWCLLITSRFENLCLPLDSEQPCWIVRTDSEVQICFGR
jgi:hypothetical protein